MRLNPAIIVFTSAVLLFVLSAAMFRMPAGGFGTASGGEPGIETIRLVQPAFAEPALGDSRLDEPRLAIDDCRYDTSRAITLPLEDVVGADDPVYGNPSADVVVVEFFDPNCVHCRALHPALKETVEAYRDRIRYYRKPFALSRHSLTQVAAMLIAAEHGKYHEMVDRQMESPEAPYLSDSLLVELAVDVGLDREVFESELASGVHLNRVELLRRQARGAGVRGTPTVLINRSDQVLAAGIRSADCIGALIEAELEAAAEAGDLMPGH